MTERLTRFEIYSHDHQSGFDRRAGADVISPDIFKVASHLSSGEDEFSPGGQ